VWVLAQRNKITPDELDRTHVSPVAEAREGAPEPTAA
jgi:hypothetical protein